MDKRLFEILACPLCKHDLELRDKELVCCKCQKFFPVENGIPVLLPEKSQSLVDGKEGSH